MNYAVINSQTNLVVNVIVWDGLSQWSPPDFHLVIQSDTAGIGWSYNPIEGTFSSPQDQ